MNYVNNNYTYLYNNDDKPIITFWNKDTIKDAPRDRLVKPISTKEYYGNVIIFNKSKYIVVNIFINVVDKESDTSKKEERILQFILSDVFAQITNIDEYTIITASNKNIICSGNAQAILYNKIKNEYCGMNKDILYQKIEIINSSDKKQLKEIKKLKLDEITKQNKELEEMIKKFEQQDINQKDIEEMKKTFEQQGISSYPINPLSIVNRNIITGFDNIGNSCFFNSYVQLLFNSERLVRAFEKNQILKEDMKLYFNTHRNVIGPNELNIFKHDTYGICDITQKDRNKWQIGVQEDSSDYLARTLNNINDKNISQEYSYIQTDTKHYRGDDEANYRCVEIKTSSDPGIIYEIINIQKFLVKRSSLNLLDLYKDGLINIIEPECTVLKNPYEPKVIRRMDQSTEHTFSNIILFKLNIFDITQSRANKIKNEINIPLLLDLPNGSYSLIGVVAHMGESISYGHYISYVTRDRRNWKKINDSYVTDFIMINNNCSSIYKDGFSPFILMYEKN